MPTALGRSSTDVGKQSAPNVGRIRTAFSSTSCDFGQVWAIMGNGMRFAAQRFFSNAARSTDQAPGTPTHPELSVRARPGVVPWGIPRSIRGRTGVEQGTIVQGTVLLGQVWPTSSQHKLEAANNGFRASFVLGLPNSAQHRSGSPQICPNPGQGGFGRSCPQRGQPWP